jgi:putative restriction endonuclease
MAYTVDDVVHLTAASARAGWVSILDRPPAPVGQRQVDFTPIEVVLCLAAMFVVDHGYWNTSTRREDAPSPIPELAALFERKNSSILSKMANLDGSRPKGAKADVVVSEHLLTGNAEGLMHAYDVILRSARRLGIDSDRLPDFLEVTGATGDRAGLGAPDATEVEVAVQEDARVLAAKLRVAPEVTERLLVEVVRVGQGRFARGVVANFGGRCAFCGLDPGPSLRGKGLIVASHIKAWRDCRPPERLDVANGVSACRNHDAVFDRGLLYLTDSLMIETHPALARRIHEDEPFRAAYGSPPVAHRLLLPAGAVKPRRSYLRWHRDLIPDREGWVVKRDVPDLRAGATSSVRTRTPGAPAPR